MKKGYKICPHCWKEIKSVAIKCQHCLKFLDEEPEEKTKECPFCLNEIDINETTCPFCEEALEKENKIKKFFSSKWKEKEEKNSMEDKSNKKPSWGKFRRLLVVLYFLITIPIVFIAIVWIRNNTEIYSRSFYFRNFYKTFFRIVIVIVGYIMITDLFRRICSFIWNWSFNGFLNYKKLFTKHRLYVLMLVLLLTTLWILDSYRTNKIKNACTWDWEILHKNLNCTCEENYSLVDWKCEKSDFLKLDDAIVKYSKTKLGQRYYLDDVEINNGERIALFVDTSIDGWSLPEFYEEDIKYWDPLATNVQSEWLAKAVWQWYIVAYEKEWNDYIINDLYKIPDFYWKRALPYPVLNSKMANYETYWWPETHDEEDRYVFDYTRVLKLRDIDWDWINNEFFLINHIDCWTEEDNFLVIWYNPNTKKINQYYFKQPYSQHKTDRTTLERWSQNKFVNWTLPVEYKWHMINCKENWNLKFNKNNMTFETKDYKVSEKCEYYAD